MNGTSPLSIGVDGATPGEPRAIDLPVLQIENLFPIGRNLRSAGLDQTNWGATCRAHPQIARSAPSGSCDGLAIQPRPFGFDPRTNTTVEPSSLTITSVMSGAVVGVEVRELDRRERRRRREDVSLAAIVADPGDAVGLLRRREHERERRREELLDGVLRLVLGRKGRGERDDCGQSEEETAAGSWGLLISLWRGHREYHAGQRAATKAARCEDRLPRFFPEPLQQKGKPEWRHIPTDRLLSLPPFEACRTAAPGGAKEG